MLFSIELFISYTKCSFQVSLASEFMCNYLSRDVTASFGYDYILRQVVFSFMNSIMDWNLELIHIYQSFLSIGYNRAFLFIYISALGGKIVNYQPLHHI